MTEALRVGLGLIFAGGLMGGVAYAIRAMNRHTIPQEDIDAEARQLIAQHGAEAMSVAEGNVQRAQWAKGKNDSMEKIARVLKAVRESSEFQG